MNESKEIAERIRALREIEEIELSEMAKLTGKTMEEYQEYEAGNKDFSFSFLFTLANRFGAVSYKHLDRVVAWTCLRDSGGGDWRGDAKDGAYFCGRWNAPCDCCLRNLSFYDECGGNLCL